MIKHYGLQTKRCQTLFVLSAFFCGGFGSLQAASVVTRAADSTPTASPKVKNASLSGAGLFKDKDTKKATKQDSLRDYLKQITPELLYSYVDFKFDSSNSDNFNRYKGHSNLYSAGADHIKLSESIFAGLYYFRIDTSVDSQFLLLPGSLTNVQQDIHNNTLFAHVLKSFNKNWFADIAGAYGQNQIHTDYQIQVTSTVNQQIYANNDNDSWFVSGNVIYRNAWDKLLLRVNLNALYVRTDTSSYQYLDRLTNLGQSVTPLTNKVTLFQENAELGYKISDKVIPFVNAGLIQVANYQNSRPLLTSAVNGIIPQLNLNQNGYRVGGGITFHRNNSTLRIEEKYYNSANTFESFQTVASFEYKFD